MKPLRVIVTRPAHEAVRWVGDLRAAGLEAMALPLLAIAPVGDAAQRVLQAQRARLGAYRAVMFVSVAAVDHFFASPAVAAVTATAVTDRGAVSPSAADLVTRFWATGPGTMQALRRAGVDAALIDAPLRDAPVDCAEGQALRFDSEALWQVVGPRLQRADRVLIVRGGDASDVATGRPWLAEQIQASGAVCEQVVAYRRLRPDFSDEARCLADAAAVDGTVWLFSSSQAIGNLRDWRPAVSWQQARAVATHPRIAQAAHQAGFGRVVASEPVLGALLASIESL